MKSPFYKGDMVTTDFFPKEKSVPRKVTRCYRSLTSKSGWLVDTENEKGKLLAALDAIWYHPIDKSRD